MDEQCRSYRGWRIVAVCFVMATFAWGFGFYGQGVYLAELTRLRGWSLTATSGAVTMFYFVSALMVAFVSDWIRTFGARRVTAVGLCAMGAALALIGRVDSLWKLYAAFLLMAVGWASTSLGAITNIVGMWFSARRGLAISLALTGASAGGIVVTPALQALTEAVGFERAALYAGGGLLLVLAPLAWLLMEAPPMPRAAAAGAPQAAWTRPRALRSLAFWSVAGPFAVVQTTQVAFLTHQINMYAPHIGAARAAFAVSATTAAAVAGRVLMGMVVDRLDTRVTTALCAGSQAAALVAVALWPQPAVLLGAAILYGLSVGNLITLPSLMLQREFEAGSFGVLVALTTAVNQMVFSAGPGLMGLARDAAEGYGPPMLACGVLNLAAAAAFVLLRPAVARA